MAKTKPVTRIKVLANAPFVFEKNNIGIVGDERRVISRIEFRVERGVPTIIPSWVNSDEFFGQLLDAGRIRILGPQEVISTEEEN